MASTPLTVGQLRAALESVRSVQGITDDTAVVLVTSVSSSGNGASSVGDPLLTIQADPANNMLLLSAY